MGQALAAGTIAALLLGASVAGAADLTVASAHVDVAANAGETIGVTVTVRSGGTRTAPLLGATVLVGKRVITLLPVPVGRVARNGSRTVRLLLRLPTSAPSETVATVRVCVDPRNRIRESNELNNCRAAGRVALVPKGSGGLARIAAARKAALLTPARAALAVMRLYAGDVRLEPAFVDGRDRLGALAGEQALHDVVDAYPTLAATDQAALYPYLVPPAWGHIATPKAASHRADPGLCQGFDQLSTQKWGRTSAANGNAWIWYRLDRPRDQALSPAVALWLTTAWTKLTAQFRVPLSDADVPCYNGGDGRLDVYLSPMRGAEGLTIEYPEQGKATWCTYRPSLIILGQPTPFNTAHELMHAIELAYRYKACAGFQNRWWDEGSANWAAEWVFPATQSEQRWTGLVVANSGWSLPRTGYDAYYFWRTMTEAHGVGIMNAILAALEANNSLTAVDSVLPGGLRDQWRSFARHELNAAPIGEPGFPVATSWQQWDDDPTRASPEPALTLDLHGAAEATSDAPVAGDYGRLIRLTALFVHVTVADPAIRELRLTNGIFGLPGAYFEAWLKRRDGTWIVRDYSASHEATLCRDAPDQDVTELYLAWGSTSLTTDTSTTASHEIRSRNACEPIYLSVDAFSSSETDTTAGAINASAITTKELTSSGGVFEACQTASYEPPGPCDFRVDPPAHDVFTGEQHSTLSPRCDHVDAPYTLDQPAPNSFTIDEGRTSVTLRARLLPMVGSVDDPCGAYAYGAVTPGVSATVPLATLASGTPTTFTLSADGSEPCVSTSTPGQTIAYAFSETITVHRVHQDGTPYRTG